MYRRIAVLASLAVVAAMFVGSSTASAAPGDAGVCVFAGVAGNLVDDQNGTAGIPSAQKDFTSSPAPDFEHGVYAYAGTATCAGVFGGRVVVASQNNAQIRSNGEYDNVVCGTGWAIDANGAGTEVEIPSQGIVVENVGYEIPFAGGNGPLHIGTGQESTDPEHDGPITGDYTGSGAVHIQPQSPGNCATTDVNAFDVTGSFAVVGR